MTEQQIIKAIPVYDEIEHLKGQISTLARLNATGSVKLSINDSKGFVGNIEAISGQAYKKIIELLESDLKISLENAVAKLKSI